jgi:hypothetical protein
LTRFAYTKRLPGLPFAASAFFIHRRFEVPNLPRRHPSLHRPSHVEAMLSVVIALVVLVTILPATGLLWFWFVRSSE